MTQVLTPADTVTVDDDGYLHSVDDAPAIVDSRQARYWFCHGRLHREGGPAVEYRNGARRWCVNGRYVNPSGEAPVIIPAWVERTAPGERLLRGERSSDGGEVRVWVESDDGAVIHRSNGPAVVSDDGSLGWFLHGTPLSMLVDSYLVETFSRAWGSPDRGLDDARALRLASDCPRVAAVLLNSPHHSLSSNTRAFLSLLLEEEPWL